MSVAHRTYAKALFEAAQEKGRLAKVREELADFVAAIDDVPELDAMLRNPQIDPRAKASILDDILGASDEGLPAEKGSELVRNFLRLAVEKNRGGQLRDMHKEFERLIAAEERRLTVDLTTAYELSDEEAQRIIGQIEKASGRPVDATRSVDPSLIGGLVLQAGSMRVDASVRGRIERLRRELTTAR